MQDIDVYELFFKKLPKESFSEFFRTCLGISYI